MISSIRQKEQLLYGNYFRTVDILLDVRLFRVDHCVRFRHAYLGRVGVVAISLVNESALRKPFPLVNAKSGLLLNQPRIY